MQSISLPSSLLRVSTPESHSILRQLLSMNGAVNMHHPLGKPGQSIEGHNGFITSKPLFGLLFIRRFATETSNDDEKDYYNILGVTPDCSKAKIKVAYYKLSKKCHPDVNKSEEAKFIFHEISEAYDVLSNTVARKKYDRARATFSPDYRSNIRHGQDRFKPRRTYYPMGKSEIYNFDEWHERHYSSAFEQNIKLKSRTNSIDSEDAYRLRKEKYKANQSSTWFINILLLMCIAFAVFMFCKMKLHNGTVAARRSGDEKS